MSTEEKIYESLEGAWYGHYIDQVKLILFDEICIQYKKYKCFLGENDTEEFLNYDILGKAVDKSYEMSSIEIEYRLLTIQ